MRESQRWLIQEMCLGQLLSQDGCSLNVRMNWVESICCQIVSAEGFL